MDTKTSLSKFQFCGSNIKSLSMSNPFVVLPSDEKVKRKFDVDYDVQRIEESENTLFGLIDLIVAVQIKTEGEKFNLKLILQGCFSSPPETDQKAFEEALTLNGATTLYSIARSMILNISSQAFAAGENINLPMVNMIAVKERKDREQRNKNKSE